MGLAADTTDFLGGVASAVAYSKWGKAARDVTIVVPGGHHPAFGVLGVQDDATHARVAALFEQLEHALATLHYVSYEQAVADCLTLAERLVRRLSREKLDACRFTSIPRGGLIVLGMLSMALGLRHDQVEARPSAGEEGHPLVVVDDCSLTGSRFREFLVSCSAEEVVFASPVLPSGTAPGDRV